jgi:hypothetical protein
MDIKQIGNAGAERYRLILSDGETSIQAMLFAQLNHVSAPGRASPSSGNCALQLVLEEKLQEGSIIESRNHKLSDLKGRQ